MYICAPYNFSHFQNCGISYIIFLDESIEGAFSIVMTQLPILKIERYALSYGCRSVLRGTKINSASGSMNLPEKFPQKIYRVKE